MNSRIIVSALCLILISSLHAQKAKVQTAWRALSDYEETLKEGKPNISYLGKAREAIDLALTNEDTKNKAKTHAYKLRVSYAQFQYNLNEETKKLESTVGDKNERILTAYGNTDLKDFEAAADELNTIKDLDPKFLETIQEGLKSGSGNLDEDELKLAMAAQQMKIESGNIALGKHKAKKYEEAADYFYRTGIINSILYNTKDTANFHNACVSANQAKNHGKILTYNRKMIDAKISSPYNYHALYAALIEKNDSTAAIDVLKKGRILFPNDGELLSEETSLYLSMGKQQEALNNLKISTEKDPTNPLYYFVTGMIYDNLANPKDKNNKDLEKPSNFEELFRKAETNYLKAIELKPTNPEYLFNSYFNLGAMYNNYAAMITSAKTGKVADAVKAQKETDAKAQEYYKKAIPFLEKALTVKSDDEITVTALRKLYKLTGDDAKAKQMNDRLNGK